MQLAALNAAVAEGGVDVTRAYFGDEEGSDALICAISFRVAPTPSVALALTLGDFRPVDAERLHWLWDPDRTSDA